MDLVVVLRAHTTTRVEGEEDLDEPAILDETDVVQGRFLECRSGIYIKLQMEIIYIYISSKDNHF